MSTSANRQMAVQLYNSGRALFQEGQYSQALIELRRAEDAFRVWEAHGHPFASHLSNGISGLANTLALSGLCHLKLGNFKAALTCYETSLVNSKFEKKSALRNFKQTFAENMIVCYEQKLEYGSSSVSFLDQEPEIDVSFRFPYSLPEDIIAYARLYELAPHRYAQYKDFYDRAKIKDIQIRRRSKTSDETAMKRTSLYVWGILAAIWAIYGLIVIKALVHHK